LASHQVSTASTCAPAPSGHHALVGLDAPLEVGLLGDIRGEVVVALVALDLSRWRSKPWASKSARFASTSAFGTPP
jgi:hypothetical protein